jgi:glutamate--cysteine ligase
MGRLGYQSDAQSSISVSYNCLESYAESLQAALSRPYPAYEAIGIREPCTTGEGIESYRQLATTLLQIENEFYGTIRPKRTIQPGERPLHALRERGVEYIEVRLMDLDPFEPLGISAATMRFIDIFLLHCLLGDSPPDTPQEIAALARNQRKTAARGREPGLMLERAGREVLLIDWAREIVAECRPLAERLDEVHGRNDYAAALTLAEQRLRDLDTTPSARALQAMRADFDESFAAFALAQSVQMRSELLALPFDDALAATLAEQAQASVDAQQRIEAADTLDFESFRVNYVSAAGLTPAVAG